MTTSMVKNLTENLKKLQWILSCVLIIGLITVGIITLNINRFAIRMALIAMLGYCILMLGCAQDQDKPDVSNLLFCSMLIIGYCEVTIDCLCWSINGTSNYRSLNQILVFLGYLLPCPMMYIFWLYQRKVIGIIGNKLQSTAVFLFMMVDVLYIIISTATGFLYVVDDNGSFVPGLGSNFVIIYSVGIMVLCMIDNLRLYETAHQRFTLISMIFPMILTSISLFWSNWSLGYVAFFFHFVLMYVAVQIKRSVKLMRQQKLLSEQKIELHENQTQVMISQIQPHFLYNALTAIYQLCSENVTKAQETILDFTDYLRTNMDSIQEKDPIPFRKELEHTKTYLNIERVRFGEDLNVEYDITYSDFFIPALTLQPLVENAVKYGIRGREGGGKVVISTRRANGFIYISVQDDGKGFIPDDLPQDKKSHVGISNTKNRLRLLCGGELCIKSTPGKGTTATIMLREENT